MLTGLAKERSQCSQSIAVFATTEEEIELKEDRHLNYHVNGVPKSHYTHPSTRSTAEQ